MMKNDDIEKKIADNIQKLSECDVKTPDISYFTNLVSEEKLKIEMRQNIQFSIFILVSIIIVSLALFCVIASINFYIILQLSAFVLFSLLILVRGKQEVSQNE